MTTSADATASNGDPSTGTGATSASGGESDSDDATPGSEGSSGGELLPERIGFLASSTADEVASFDSANMIGGTIFDVVAELDYPHDLTITPDGTQVWAIGAHGDGYAVFDALSPALLHQATLSGDYPANVVFDDSRAFISNTLSASLTVLDRTSFAELETVGTPGGRAAGNAARNPCTGHVYVVQAEGPALMTYDPDGGTWETELLGDTSALWEVAVHPSGDTVYALDRGTNEVHVFDVASSAGIIIEAPTTSIDVCTFPWGMGLTSDGATLAVSCRDGDAVHIIDLATNADPLVVALPESAEARGLDIDPDDAFVYVASGTLSNGDGVFRIDLATGAMTNMNFGRTNPSLVAVSPQPSTCSAR